MRNRNTTYKIDKSAWHLTKIQSLMLSLIITLAIHSIPPSERPAREMAVEVGLMKVGFHEELDCEACFERREGVC